MGINTSAPGDPPSASFYDGSDQGGRSGESPADTRLRITASVYGVDISKITSDDCLVQSHAITISQPARKP